MQVKRLEASSSTGAAKAAGQSEDVDSRAQDELACMGSTRRKIVDALTEERVSLQEANQHLEKRNQAQKVFQIQANLFFLSASFPNRPEFRFWKEKQGSSKRICRLCHLCPK